MAQIATMFITPFIMKKLKKRQLFMAGMVIATIGFAATGFTTNIAIINAMSIVKGIGFGCGAATMYGMLQDAITYGEWKNGYGTAGMGNAASSFCTKVGSGFGTAVLGWVLAAGQFDAMQAVQSAGAQTAITLSFAWIPAITMLIAVICLALFDLDKHYDAAVADLAVGKHKGE